MSQFRDLNKEHHLAAKRFTPAAKPHWLRLASVTAQARPQPMDLMLHAPHGAGLHEESTVPKFVDKQLPKLSGCFSSSESCMALYLLKNLQAL